MSHAPAAASNSLCLNCGHALAPPGCYCPQCGQAPAHRLSTAHVGHEIMHVFTHADKGILAFVPLVLLRPGRLVADYLAGRRKRHFNPFQFLLIMVGVATLLAKKLGYYDIVGAGVQAMMTARRVPAAMVARVGEYFHALGTYFNVWWLAMLPLHALVTWAVYGRRPTRLNYAESVLLLVVVSCAFQLWLVVALPTVLWVLGRQPGASTAFLQGTVTLLYLFLIGRQGLQLSWAGAVWRALLTGLLVAIINYGVNSFAFRWYVFGAH